MYEKTHIHKRIEDAKEAIAANAAKRRDLDMEDARQYARIDAYTDVLSLMSDDDESPGSQRDTTAKSPSGRRGISPMWHRILSDAASLPSETFTVDDVEEVARAHGDEAPSRGAIRSQLANYANRGTIERIKNGVFRLTPEGAAELGLEFSDGADASDENAPPEGEASTEEVGASSELKLTTHHDLG